MSKSKFDEICMNDVCGDVKVFDFDDDLAQYIEFEYNGIMYASHWLFFNTAHETDIYGVLYKAVHDDGDVLFGVVGCKYDTINHGIVADFDAVYDMLTDEMHFIS